MVNTHKKLIFLFFILYIMLLFTNNNFSFCICLFKILCLLKIQIIFCCCNCFLQASMHHNLAMNKGNGKVTKKVSVAAPPPPPFDGEHTPCNIKRRYMAGMTPFHPTAYASILAGSDHEEDELDDVDDVYASVEAARTENTPPKKKKARTAGKPCHMYCQIGIFNHVVMWFRISHLPHGAYAFCNGDGVLKGRSIRDWFAEGCIITLLVHV
jgi:hypothetical protein